ncbi:HPP family protein [Halanaerobium sp. MA284_MarDTE_T2]|uniref:CBS domain-containing protein n=1 Tax=Halanaerobium sp. MA284_MarDTE_T2 TaxID=2183913 RepID=UPI000DF127D8|nr:CBS domain-containing protein [Halanaerobium sp. MA284_MarDTE_T2]RCW48252.1 CBS domain protein [Halanaerobium sp. MA284_MarDTE_T2]
MKIVRDYMMRSMNSVSSDDLVEDAIRNMYKSELSVLPVVNDQNKFIGTIYSNNILKNIIPEQFGFIESHRIFYEVNQAVENLDDIRDERVEKYMSKATDVVNENEDMNKIADIMLNNKESLLFVVNNGGYLRGYISRADLLHFLLDEAKKN